MRAGKRRTFRTTIVTIAIHMTRDVSVFVKCECDTIFRLFSLEITTNSNFNFRKVAYVITYLRYVLYEILKIRYELTKLLP